MKIKTLKIQKKTKENIFKTLGQEVNKTEKKIQIVKKKVMAYTTLKMLLIKKHYNKGEKEIFAACLNNRRLTYNVYKTFCTPIRTGQITQSKSGQKNPHETLQ